MTEAQSDTLKPTRLRLLPRFSLLTALLLMTVVALATSVTLLWREVGPLRAEVRLLRDEAGVLQIDDRKKIHVIRVNTRDELIWRWRVWLPAGTAVYVHVTDNVSPKMTASGSGRLGLIAREKT